MAYRRLLCLYYRTEKPLSLDCGVLFRLIRATTGNEKKAVSQVLSEFFVKMDDGYHSIRCDNEIKAYEVKSAKNKENGSRGGRPKKEPNNNPPETDWVILGFENETQTKGNQEPRTKNQEPRTKNQEPRTKNQEPRTKNHIKSMAISPIEQAQESPPKTKRFVQPSIQETQEYFRELKSNQAQAFFDFYESKGWLVGKAKMKDWKAAARGWVSRQSSFEPSKPKEDQASKWNFDDILPPTKPAMRTVQPDDHLFGVTYDH